MRDWRQAAELLRAELMRDRNPDGGWGYFRGKASRVEPTALAMLAFSVPGAERVDALREGARCLRAWQLQDGLVGCGPSRASNLAFNGQAALSLIHVLGRGAVTAADAPSLQRLLRGIVAVRGSRLPLAQRVIEWWSPSLKVARQDNELQAWPWLKGTFSWVEPTAWCVLALKRSPLIVPGAASRIAEAERLLADRCCRSGGWNYGNSNILGQELRPYIPTTAITLLALGDHPHGVEVTRSLDFLRANHLKEPSGEALALATIALKRYGSDAADLENALGQHAASHDFLGNNATRALALCALTGGPGGHPAFAV